MQSASAAELNVYVNAGPILIDINFLDPAKPLEANDIEEATPVPCVVACAAVTMCLVRRMKFKRQIG